MPKTEESSPLLPPYTPGWQAISVTPSPPIPQGTFIRSTHPPLLPAPGTLLHSYEQVLCSQHCTPPHSHASFCWWSVGWALFPDSLISDALLHFWPSWSGPCNWRLQQYCKMHDLASIEPSPELLRDLGKFIIYCKIHGWGSIERSPELLQDPERLWNHDGVRATVFTMDFFSRNHCATYVLQFLQSWPCNWRSRQYCKIHGLSSIERSLEFLQGPGK